MINFIDQKHTALLVRELKAADEDVESFHDMTWHPNEDRIFDEGYCPSNLLFQ